MYTGNASVDHFLPKSTRPDLAYEWSNFRLAAARYNSRKRDRLVCDPFTLSTESFYLDFNSRLIRPNPQLSYEILSLLRETIDYLGLNEELSIRGREHWIAPYVRGEITLEHLRKKAPFIAYELTRQGLTDKLRA